MGSSNSSVNNRIMKKGYKVRRAHFAGSWYEASKSKLDAILTTNLANVALDTTDNNNTNNNKNDIGIVVRGLVAPHAGYSYSGLTAAYAYQSLYQALEQQNHQQQEAAVTVTVDTILLLHPSHHVYLDGCALSGAESIETPLGNLPVATTLRDELWATQEFSMMDQETDEHEHSGEMHYPYIAKCCNDAHLPLDRIKVLPIMVGGISSEKEQHFGTLLKPIVARPNIITIVSTDFCHWGSRFRYQPTSSSSSSSSDGASKDNPKPIFEHISEMDHVAMNHIEMQQPGAFAQYIRNTRNTICGRHPLAVWLHAISQNKESGVETLDVKFVRYAQSSKVRSMQDSSVSYASAVATKSR